MWRVLEIVSTLLLFLHVFVTCQKTGNGLSDNDFIGIFRNESALTNLIDSENGDKTFSADDLPAELRDWEPPEYIRKHFPVYFSGYDFDDRPIWVSEMGKYDLHSFLQKGPKAEEELEKYAAYAARIMLDSAGSKDSSCSTGSFILDFEDLKFTNFAQFESVAFLLKIGYRFRKLLEDGTEYTAIINANYAAQTAINAARPMIGRVMEVVEVYGTDKSKWLPQLLRHFPRESLPEWYGGHKNFTPIRVL